MHLTSSRKRFETANSFRSTVLSVHAYARLSRRRGGDGNENGQNCADPGRILPKEGEKRLAFSAALCYQ